MTTVFSLLPSPLGPLLLLGSAGILEGVHVAGHPHAPQPPAGAIRDDGALDAARRQLAEYFAGTRRQFDLPVETAATPWQAQVWSALGEIPYGTTLTYGGLAARLGRPGAARAVGGANGANPLSIVVPCHRVVGAGGSLGGYGWGLERKRWLLEHERSVLAGAADGR